MTRAEDEMLLDLLRRHCRGERASVTAAATGLTRQAVSQRISAVIRQDRRHDPDAARYWAGQPPKGSSA
jgi:hypothetical protein